MLVVVTVLCVYNCSSLAPRSGCSLDECIVTYSDHCCVNFVSHLSLIT